MTISDQKSRARELAFLRRKAAFDEVNKSASYDLVPEVLSLTRGARIVAGYMAMRTEIDPLPAMRALVDDGVRVCVPVILGQGKPLEFREWRPDAAMQEGAFGALIPVDGEVLRPDFVLAPLVAFDAVGMRLGYGGGFYDRTIRSLRAERGVHYWGLAFDAQCSDELLPREDTDVVLDGVVTELGLRGFDFP